MYSLIKHRYFFLVQQLFFFLLINIANLFLFISFVQFDFYKSKDFKKEMFLMKKGFFFLNKALKN